MANRLKGLLWVVIFGLSGMANHGMAHHSSAPHFDKSIHISLDAVVTRWAFVNPHAYLYFDVTEDSGETNNWRCEFSSATNIGRNGFTKETFVSGQHLTILGSPARREDHVCWLESLIFADGTKIDRDTDLPADKVVGEPTVLVLADASQRPEYLANGQPNISGYWVLAGQLDAVPDSLAPRPRRTPIDSTPIGLAEQAEFVQIYDDPSIHCDITNIFFGWTHGENVNEIIQLDDRIILKYGYMDFVRTIYLDMQEHPADIQPGRGGHSIGRWQGDTLIVDTIGFTPGYIRGITGVPHGSELRTTERFRYNAETKTLDRSYIAEDPVYLNSPYTGEDQMDISATPSEPYNCIELSGENNRRPES